MHSYAIQTTLIQGKEASFDYEENLKKVKQIICLIAGTFEKTLMADAHNKIEADRK